jgi:hypothetical protein
MVEIEVSAYIIVFSLLFLAHVSSAPLGFSCPKFWCGLAGLTMGRAPFIGLEFCYSLGVR